jgi:GPH family glycoside/pentoside/hexuronide:cation symporter
MSTESRLKPLSALHRYSYAVGAIANGIKNVAFTAYLMFFYNQVIGISAGIVSLAVSLTLIVDAFADPFIGRWSDNTRSRWGRRHPFIYGAIIPTTVFFTLAWFPPHGLSELATGVWIFVTALLTRSAMSAFEINTQAMTAELTEDYRERTKLFSLRYWFLYIGQYGFSTVALLAFFVATPEYPRGQLNPQSYVGFALFGGAMIFISMLACGLGTHGRIPDLRQSAPETAGIGVRGHIKETLSAFRNRAFLAIFGFGVLKFTAIGLFAATDLYFSTYLFQLTPGQLAILTVDSVVAATIAAPLAPIMSNWLGKRTSSMLFAILGVAAALTPLCLTYFGLFFRPGDPALLPTLFVIGAVYGAMVAISLINTSSMLADVVEDNAVRSGRHEAGTYFAASSFMQQCATALGIMASGVILSWAHFPQKAKPGGVSQAMLDSLILHYVPVSFSLWALGCVVLCFYPITRERHERNLATLRAREAEARSREADNLPLGLPSN